MLQLVGTVKLYLADTVFEAASLQQSQVHETLPEFQYLTLLELCDNRFQQFLSFVVCSEYFHTAG